MDGNIGQAEVMDETLNCLLHIVPPVLNVAIILGKEAKRTPCERRSNSSSQPWATNSEREEKSLGRHHLTIEEVKAA